MKYQNLFSQTLPVSVELPPGLRADTKYVFSVTYADRHAAPYEGLVEAVRTAMQAQGTDLAKYPPPQGHTGMRELIAGNLKTRRGVDTPVDSIFLSGGAGGAIQCILDAFIDPGDIVLVEEFTYLGTLTMLLARQARPVHVPTDEQGMDIDALEDTIRWLASQGRRPKMIYTIPVYQNPMGMTMSLDRRKRLVEISQRYGVPILENESYADFRIDGDPLPPAIKSMDTEGSVMYVSAYTKLLGCGLRLGYAVVPDPVRVALAKLRFGGSPSHLAAMAVHHYLRAHHDEHMRNVRQSLKSKRDAMLAALDENFPGCSRSEPGGGMMIWARLPEGADTWAALDRAVEAGVKYNPGPLFRADRDCNNYLRLTYSHNSPEEISEGIAILAEVFQREGLIQTARG